MATATSVDVKLFRSCTTHFVVLRANEIHILARHYDMDDWTGGGARQSIRWHPLLRWAGFYDPAHGATLPVFTAMMFGGTLGGNATLISASANIVSGGICVAHGKPVRFVTFLRYGVPVTLAQLVIAAAYVVALNYLLEGRSVE